MLGIFLKQAKVATLGVLGRAVASSPLGQFKPRFLKVRPGGRDPEPASQRGAH
jgi:hypothetical protein